MELEMLHKLMRYVTHPLCYDTHKQELVAHNGDGKKIKGTSKDISSISVAFNLPEEQVKFVPQLKPNAH
jgi:hypothetical protein